MKNNSVVGCWPLAVGLGLGAMCVFDVPLAHAGYWRIEPASQIPYSAPNRQAEVEKRYNGKFEAKAEGFPNNWYGGSHYDNSSQPVDLYGTEVRPFGGNDWPTNQGGVFWYDSYAAMPEGGKGSVKASGTVGVVLRYSPSRIEDYETDSSKVDPNDKPDKPIYIKVVVSPSVYAEDGNSNSNTSNPQDNDPLKEHVTFEAEPAGDVAGDSSTIGQRFEPIPYAGTSLEGRRTFYLRFDPTNKGEVDENGDMLFIVPLVYITNAEAKLDGDRKTFRSYMNASEWNEGRVQVLVSVESTLTPYALSIASSLGQTYHKVASDSDLPTLTNPNNGSVGVDINRIRPETPYNGANSGPWGVLNSSGKADSVPQWKGYLHAWTGGGDFSSVESGFVAPVTRTWTVGGNGPISQNVSSKVAYGLNPLDNFYWNLGGDASGNFDENSSLTVKVDDGSGIGPLTSTYSANWHKEDENWEEDGNRTHPLPNQLIPLGPYAATGVQIPYKYADRSEFDYKSAGSVISGITGVGAAAVTLFLPEATVPAAVLGFISSVAGGAEFFDGSESDYEATSAPQYVPANYTAFQTDVLSYSGLGPSDPNANGTFEIQSDDPDVRDAIIQSLQDGSQTYFNGSHLSVTLNLVIKKEEQFWNSDGYDAKGYAGKQTSKYRKVIKHQYNRVWGYNDTRPTGGNQGGAG